jgi:putative nucleotidyltransferase with HDIG domain
MEKGWIERLHAWFDTYTAGFYNGDTYVNANIRFKYDHSLRTEAEILDLASELNLDEDQKAVAQAAGLLHDIGRFEQFGVFRTFSDCVSVDHGWLGTQVLHQSGVLTDLDPHLQHLLCTAVHHHNKRRLPAHLIEPDLLYCRLVRDADKLDILQSLIHVCQTLRTDPEGFELEMGLPDDPRCTPTIVEAVLHGQTVPYSDLRTFNDVLLVQLGWVYDVNFIPTFSRIKDRRLLGQILALLPDLPEVHRIGGQVMAYVDDRLAETPVTVTSC